MGLTTPTCKKLIVMQPHRKKYVRLPRFFKSCRDEEEEWQ
jgi:hypothetical protein